jgi:hypothetical protein
MNEGMIILDGDFLTGAPCRYHCSPTCHPGQVDEDKWHYGCLHKAWPQNRFGDFCPLVECGGDPEKCEIPKRLLKNMRTGKLRKRTNAYRKIETLDKEIRELDLFVVKVAKGANR